MISKIQIDTDFQTLMEIVEKTMNPVVAIALLNGTYQQPMFWTCDMAQESKDQKTGDPITKKLTFVSYNKWEDKIDYSEGPHNWVRSMSRKEWDKLSVWGMSDFMENLQEVTPQDH
jgi:hypothetical protein